MNDSHTLHFQRTLKFTLLLRGEKSNCLSGNDVKAFFPKNWMYAWGKWKCSNAIFNHILPIYVFSALRTWP